MVCRLWHCLQPPDQCPGLFSVLEVPLVLVEQRWSSVWAAFEQRFMKLRSSVRHRTTQAHLVGDIEAIESFWTSAVKAA